MEFIFCSVFDQTVFGDLHVSRARKFYSVFGGVCSFSQTETIINDNMQSVPSEILNERYKCVKQIGNGAYAIVWQVFVATSP